LNENTFKSIKKRLIEAGLVRAVNTGRQTRNGSAEYAYEITGEGRQAIVSGWAFNRSKGEGVSRVDEGVSKGETPFLPLKGEGVKALHPFGKSPFSQETDDSARSASFAEEVVA